MLSVLYTESHNQVLYTEFIMLSVVMLSVVMLNVAAPNKQPAEVWKNWFNLKTLFFNGDCDCERRGQYYNEYYTCNLRHILVN